MARPIPLLESLRGICSSLTRKGAKAAPDDGVGTLKVVPFDELATAWRKRCAAFPIEPGPANRRRAAVLVTPWLGTPVPFYNLEIARSLAAAGDRVEVIFDASDVFGNAPNPAENRAIEEALPLLPEWMRIHRVDDIAAPPVEPEDTALAEQIIRENAVWRTHGEDTAAGFVERKREAVARLGEHVAKVRTLVAERGFEWVLIPGGIWGVSRAYVSAAGRAGIHFATYDAGGGLVLAQDGIASHQHDLARALAMTLDHITPEGRARMIEWTRSELDQRMKGRGNYFNFQAVAASGAAADGPNIFVPLNLRWDSAALGRERLFPSVKEWVKAIVRWAAAEPRARVCFRQHPVERYKAFRTTDDIGALIRETNTAGDRVRFVAAGDPVNSYDLLHGTRALLPYCSSMGTEAPVLGIPVITSAHNYYDSFEFIHRAESPGHYFELASRAIRGELTVTESQRDLAAIVYCLVQHCNFMPTGFTAVPTAFLEWVKVPPDELWQQIELRDLHRALQTGEPLAFIRQQRFTGAE